MKAMKSFAFITLMYLTGCATAEQEPVSFMDYLCPTYQAFRNMQDSSDTSDCERVIKNDRLIVGRKINMDVEDLQNGGILPVSIQKADGSSLTGFMMFPPVQFLKRGVE